VRLRQELSRHRKTHVFKVADREVEASITPVGFLRRIPSFGRLRDNAFHIARADRLEAIDACAGDVVTYSGGPAPWSIAEATVSLLLFTGTLELTFSNTLFFEEFRG
jgi:hypothetical protein